MLFTQLEQTSCRRAVRIVSVQLPEWHQQPCSSTEQLKEDQASSDEVRQMFTVLWHLMKHLEVFQESGGTPGLLTTHLLLVPKRLSHVQIFIKETLTLSNNPLWRVPGSGHLKPESLQRKLELKQLFLSQLGVWMCWNRLQTGKQEIKEQIPLSQYMGFSVNNPVKDWASSDIEGELVGSCLAKTCHWWWSFTLFFGCFGFRDRCWKLKYRKRSRKRSKSHSKERLDLTECSCKHKCRNLKLPRVCRSRTLFLTCRFVYTFVLILMNESCFVSCKWKNVLESHTCYVCTQTSYSFIKRNERELIKDLTAFNIIWMMKEHLFAAMAAVSQQTGLWYLQAKSSWDMVSDNPLNPNTSGSDPIWSENLTCALQRRKVWIQNKNMKFDVCFLPIQKNPALLGSCGFSQLQCSVSLN